MKLELYYYPSCPFCRIVIEVIHQLELKVDYKNIHEDFSNMEKLKKDTGRTTVPCLYIDNNPMFESYDIMEWLKTNKDKLEKVYGS
ncbi:MAG: glutaredoxin [Epsilonproteobacteria bacterium]|nr:MAG: glutaredoxin [Campylobacterota bacterium]RLA66152.1 MAG: glutaredoxin [Campylobacterota bacterium]